MYLPDELVQLQLLVRDVPLLKVDAGLASLTVDGASVSAATDRRGQVVQAVLIVVLH